MITECVWRVVRAGGLKQAECLFLFSWDQYVEKLMTAY